MFSLNDLQKEANRRYGFTAQQVLDAAQALYDQHVTSYPRTESRHITPDIADTLGDRLNGLRALTNYRPLLDSIARPLAFGRLVNQAKVAEAGHYAIIPTGQTPTAALSESAGKVYDLICRRLMAALLPAGQDERTTLITEANGQSFQTTGIRVVVPGWRVAWQPAPATEETEADEDNPTVPGELRQGEAVTVQAAEIATKETKAPPRLTDASLLGLMEKHGLGTPATRARIVEVLIRRQYVERKQKVLQTTDKG